jgi:dehydrogenase/reductase SDR family protein 7B
MAKQQLAGKVVWITGASSGLGEALAKQLAAQGAELVLSARRVDELQRVLVQLPRQAQHLIVPFDATDDGAMDTALQQAINIKGKVDWLINNAGISQRSLVEDTSAQTDRRIMEVDYFAPVALTRKLLPHLLQQGTGKVVFVSSVAGLLGTQYRASYAAAKGAIHLWANSLRAEVADRGVSVAVVFPGFVKTNVSINALTGDGSALGSMDDAQANAMSSDQFAQKLVKALLDNEEFIVIGGLKERFGVWLSRLSPELMYKVIRKSKVR